MPPELRVAPPLRCPACGSTSGLWSERGSPCKVFCTHKVVDVRIVEHVCCGCSRGAPLDGSEVFILRKADFQSSQLGAFEVAFHWPLLYDAVEELMNGVHWNTSWTQQLHKYARMGIPSTDLQAFMQSLYRHFREAVQDFVDLQCLPFDDVLRCKCAVRHQNLVADGITVSCMRSCLRFCAPWLPQPAAPGEPPVQQHYGSDFKSRFALERNVREALRPLTSAGGVCELDFLSLQQIAGEHLSALLSTAAPSGVVLQSGRATCLPWAQTFLRELSANSPACAIVRPAVVPAVERFLQLVDEVESAEAAERQQKVALWTIDEQQEMERQLQLLWPAMHLAWRLVGRNEQLALRVGICGLLHQLLQARSVLLCGCRPLVLLCDLWKLKPWLAEQSRCMPCLTWQRDDTHAVKRCMTAPSLCRQAEPALRQSRHPRRHPPFSPNTFMRPLSGCQCRKIGRHICGVARRRTCEQASGHLPPHMCPAHLAALAGLCHYLQRTRRRSPKKAMKMSAPRSSTRAEL